MRKRIEGQGERSVNMQSRCCTSTYVLANAEYSVILAIIAAGPFVPHSHPHGHHHNVDNVRTRFMFMLGVHAAHIRAAL